MYFVGYLYLCIGDVIQRLPFVARLRTKIGFGMNITRIFRNAIGNSENRVSRIPAFSPLNELFYKVVRKVAFVL